MIHSKQEIAALFSNGKFENTINHLSDSIVWNIVGESIFTGKQAVTEQCKQTAAYFNSVETDFRTTDILTSENMIVISGTAEFRRNGKKLNFVSACDIYKFNDQGKIEYITSYCIPEKKI